jgi:hypothetical protein
MTKPGKKEEIRMLWNDNPAAEGIGKIKIMLQPYLLFYLNHNLIYKSDDKRGVCWYRTGKKGLFLYARYTRHKDFLYLIIREENIGAGENISSIIVNALYDVISSGIIGLNKKLFEISTRQKNYKRIPKGCLVIKKEFIVNNISQFIYNIKELEIFFDMPLASILIKNRESIFDTADPQFQLKLIEFKNEGWYSETGVILRHGDAYYLLDMPYQNDNHNAIQFTRKQKLFQHGNFRGKKMTGDYPYDMNVVFRLTNRNTQYTLNIFNLECNSKELLKKYYFHLRKYFNQYFNGIINFTNISHLSLFPLICSTDRFNSYKYTEIKLVHYRRKYTTKEDIYDKLSNFNNILYLEYKKQKDEYFKYRAVIDKSLKKGIISPEFITLFGIYNINTNEAYGGISIGDEYAPIGKCWQTPFGYTFQE